MKIGILTLPPRANYGGILQAYALQTVLERMGNEVELIRIQKRKPRGLILRLCAYGFRMTRNLFRKDKTPVFIEYYEKNMSKHTWRFIQSYIHQTVLKDFTEENLSKYDVIVVGSDQIWRRQYIPSTGLNIADVFGKSILESKIRLVAYAASFGVHNWEFTKDETEIIRCGLEGFKAVSVREDSGVVLCRNLGINAKHVIDPTMLLDKSDYLRLVDKSKIKCRKSGLMTYVLDMTSEKEAFIQRLAEEKGLNIFATNNPKVSDPNAKLSEKQQPPLEQWLQGFEDAEFVITDSFHACVFSILFGKPFVAIGNSERGMARFTSLLNMFGLQKHLLVSLSDYNPNDNYEIDSSIKKKLDEYRKEGMQFLDEALN